MKKTPANPRTLSFEDKVRVAWAYYCESIPQQTLASLYGVNSGRISEACTSVKNALED